MYSVLYVDDEQDLLDLAKLFLERSPEFRVETRTSAQDALDSPVISTCDVIVSDYQMPEMDGIAFLKAVRRRFGALPFILFTGRGREEVVIEAINNGVDFYLQKGGDPRSQFAELSHKIRMAVERKRAVDGHIESDKRLSSIFHASPIHQMITEFSTGRVLDINDRFLKDLKLSRSAVIGRTMDEIGLFFDEPRYSAIIQQLEREGVVRNAELLIRDRSGRTYATLTSLTRVQVHGQDLVYTQSMDITAQNKAQQTINALLNAPPGVSLMLDTNGVILAANNAAAVRFGLPVHKLTGMDAYDLISPDLADLRRMKVQEAVATRKPLVYLDDRTGRSYENHLYPVIGPDGEVSAVAIHSHDVTEERQAKEALKESEAKYRLVVEHSHDTIYIYRENHFLFINRQAEDLTGFTHDELMKRDIWDFIHPDDRKRLKEASVKRFAGGYVSSSFQAKISRKDGGVREGEFFVDVVDFLGKPAILGIARDITDTKRAEEAIREQEERLRSLSDNIPNGMVYQAVIEPDGKRRFAHVSAGVERIHEVTAENMLRDSSVFYNQMVKEDRILLKEAEDRALAAFTPLSFETRICTPSGTERRILLHSAPRLLAGGGTIWDGIEIDITDERRREKALMESEELHRKMVAALPDVVVQVDLEGKIIYINQNGVNLTGFANETEVIGKSMFSFFAPECIPLAEANTRLMFKRPLGPVEYMFLTKDNRRIPLEVNGDVLRTPEGIPYGMVFLCRDIQRRKMAEAALRESEENYRSLFMASPDGIAMVDTKGILTYVSPKSLEMFGFSVPDEVIGTHILEWIEEDDRSLAWERFSQVPFDDGFVSHSYRVHRKNGSQFFVEMHSAALHNSDGSVRGLISIFRDITNRRRAEEELRTSEENYRRIIENMQDVYYRVNRDGIITMISPYGARLIGFESPADIIGKYAATDFYADPKERDEFISYLFKEGAVSGYLLTLLDRHGKIHSATASSRLIYDEAGNYIGIDGILHDVTHLKQVENALRQANRQLTLMTSITRHDIRNQLMALGGWLELSRASVLDPDRMLELITREQRIASIIEEQINFTMFFEEMGGKEPVWQDPAPLFRKSMSILPFKAIRLDPEVIGIEILADPLFEKVFYNLFDNALRYGGPAMTTIRVFTCQDGSTFKLIVEDDGTGISEKDKTCLFDRGFGKNTGLGLFLVKEILAITGITIREMGIPGIGARFEITVPAGKYRVAGTGSQNS